MKIKAIYKRDPKGKILIGEFSDDIFNYLGDCCWIATEKIDGTNTRIIWDGHRISWKGATEKTVMPDFEQKWLSNTFGTPEKEELFEQVFGEKEAIVFGEFCGHKIQKSGELMFPTSNDFIVFDIVINGHWLSYDNMSNVASNIGCKYVKMARTGTLRQIANYIEKNGASLTESTSGNNAPLEGYVCFPSEPLYFSDGTPIKVKVKVRDLVEGGYKL